MGYGLGFVLGSISIAISSTGEVIAGVLLAGVGLVIFAIQFYLDNQKT